jgi:hypothetical protein
MCAFVQADHEFEETAIRRIESVFAILHQFLKPWIISLFPGHRIGYFHYRFIHKSDVTWVS